MEAYALLACFILLIAFLCMCAVALVLGERVMHLEFINANLRLTNSELASALVDPGQTIDPYVKRALDRAQANASSVISGERPERIG